MILLKVDNIIISMHITNLLHTTRYLPFHIYDKETEVVILLLFD